MDKDDFKWLRRAARGSTFNSCSPFSHLPASSFDWGASGYAGCSNYGGELLYLSAPSPSNGLIMARGNFSTSFYASLSRAQIEFGGPSTFGLEVSRVEHEYDPDPDESNPAKWGSSFQLGDMIERGSFNYRWPFNEYYLDRYRKPDATEHKQEKHVGTCQMFSCVEDGIFYQVLRIEEGPHIDKESVGDGNFDKDSNLCRHFPAKPQVVLTMGGPVWFQSFKDRLHEHILTKRGQVRANSWPEQNDIQYSSVGPQTDEVSDISPESESSAGKFDTIRFWDENRKIGLEADIHQLQLKEGKYEYSKLELIRSGADVDNGPAEIQTRSGPLAYNVVCPLQQLPDREQVHKEHRSATFLARIRLYEGDKDGGGKWPEHPTSEEIYDYVGVKPSSPNATGAMWETVFIERRNETDPIVDLAEVNLVGRSLEKILQVDITPATFHSVTNGARDQAGTPTALVSNLFIRPSVGLEALFWKVRFLSRAYKFLSCLRELYQQSGRDQGEEANPNGSRARCDDSDVKDMLNIAEFQLTRIRGHIENVVQYLVRALLEPGLITQMMPDSHTPGQSNYFYVMTTIWYVAKSFTDWNSDWKESIKKWNKGEGRLSNSNRLPPENWTFGMADKDRVPLLQWYHHSSILNLCQAKILPETWQDDDLERRVFGLAKAAKVASAAKLSSRQPYTAEDEIIDRLSVLSDELDPERLERGRIGTVALLSIERASRRDLTRNLSPGWLPHPEEGSTSGPWEIYALCHHSRLVVLHLEGNDSQDWRAIEHRKEEAESYKRNIYHFLNAEGTLVPCWERAHAKAREGLLCSEATAVLATTILTMHEKNTKVGLPGIAATNTKGDSGGTTSTEQDQSNLLREIAYMESLMKAQLEVLEKSIGEVGRLPQIRWTRFSPPRRYHPESFTNSLDDTPKLYRPPLINKFSVPISLRGHATLSNEMEHEFKMDDFTKSILKSLWVWDIRATRQDKDASGFIWEVRPKPLTYDTLDQNTPGTEGSLLSWALYDNLVDQEVQHRFLIVRSPSLPKDLLNLLIYVLHNESAACLGNHVLRYSRFSCLKRDPWVASITLRCWRVDYSDLSNQQTITPTTETTKGAVTQGKSGCQRTATTNSTTGAASENQSTSSPQVSTDDEPIYLPIDLKPIWSVTQENLTFELDMASIIISTNAFGDFSKCTIVSKLIDESDMKAIVEDARKLWQQFIHQPQTARCLAFFLVLGKLCQQITKNYEDAIYKLVSIWKLDTSPAYTERQWSMNNKAVLEFELGLWSLKSLYTLQNSLKSTIDSLLEAKEKLVAQINCGPGKRSIALERMCQEYLEDFENSIVQTTAVHERLVRRIELATRYKGTFSTMLAIRDSRTALRQSKTSLSQNSAIQKLTYLTIAYLPIALMATIFAIPKEQQVVFTGMGVGWFVGAILLLSAVTYIMALYIDDILNFIKFPTGDKSKLHEPESPPADSETSSLDTQPRPPPNFWRWLSNVL